MTAFAILSFATISMAQVPSYVPTTGLVGWWPFNGNANDESGNGNNGTVNGATLTTDRNGSGNSAYSFDGVNDYILSPGGANYINDSLTISFWIYNTTNSFSNAELICIGSSSSTYYGVVCSNLGTRLNYGRGCGETTQTNANSPFSLNTWNHIVIRSFAAPNQTEVYLNGNFRGYASNSNPAGCSNSNLYFGVDIFSVAEYYLGLLDDIGIWNRALTPQEITDLYTSSALAISEVSQSNLFSVFPNPAQSIINVKADNKLIGDVYSIYDNTGRVVLTGKLNSQNTTIELGNLSGGIYMVSVGENMNQTFKVIKE